MPPASCSPLLFHGASLSAREGPPRRGAGRRRAAATFHGYAFDKLVMSPQSLFLRQGEGMKASRPLYVVAYDITEPARLRRVHDAVKAYSTGGQKSVHEGFPARRELSCLRQELRRRSGPKAGCVMILRPEARLG